MIFGRQTKNVPSKQNTASKQAAISMVPGGGTTGFASLLSSKTHIHIHSYTHTPHSITIFIT